MSAGRLRLAAWAASLALPLVVSLTLVAVRSRFANAAVALLLVGGVTAVAVLADRVAGYLATLSAGAWFDFYWTRPYDRFTIGHRPDLETFVCLVGVGVAVTELAQWSRRSRRRHHESAWLVAAIADASSLAASSEPAVDVVERVAAMLIEVLELRACRFEPGGAEPPRARLLVTGDVENAGLLWPVDEWGLPGPETEIVVSWRGRMRGSFVLSPRTAHPVSLERRVAAVAIAESVAGALPGVGARGGP